jgi:hypothetical protein
MGNWPDNSQESIVKRHPANANYRDDSRHRYGLDIVVLRARELFGNMKSATRNVWRLVS